MKKPTKQEVLDAAADLVRHEDPETVNRWLNALEPAVDVGVDFEVTGDAAFLQPLLSLRRKDINTYVALMQRIDDAREDQGLMPLSERRGKRAYLADFMRVKRQRENRVVELWNQQFSEREKLRGRARNEFKVEHARRWNAAREARLETLRQQLGRALTLEEIRVAVEQHHEEIDAELDALEEFVRQELRTPLSQRDPSRFKWRVGTL